MHSQKGWVTSVTGAKGGWGGVERDETREVMDTEMDTGQAVSFNFSRDLGLYFK